MYNRVGNLTLLSLSRRRNSIIESLHTFTHENRNWHERFNLRFPEEDQTDFASIRIYWKYKQGSQAKPNDAADMDESISAPQGEHKISTNNPMKPHSGKTGGPPSEKSYYLFSSNKVTCVERHDYTRLRKYLNKRLDEY